MKIIIFSIKIIVLFSVIGLDLYLIDFLKSCWRIRLIVCYSRMCPVCAHWGKGSGWRMGWNSGAKKPAGARVLCSPGSSWMCPPVDSGPGRAVSCLLLLFIGQVWEEHCTGEIHTQGQAPSSPGWPAGSLRSASTWVGGARFQGMMSSVSVFSFLGA